MPTVRIEYMFDDGHRIFRGEFAFLQLPAKGDKINILERGGASDSDGSTDVVEVLFIEHFPHKLVPGKDDPLSNPTATVVVQWLGGRSG